jgi:hypothetical protein
VDIIIPALPKEKESAVTVQVHVLQKAGFLSYVRGDLTGIMGVCCRVILVSLYFMMDVSYL